MFNFSSITYFWNIIPTYKANVLKSSTALVALGQVRSPPRLPEVPSRPNARGCSNSLKSTGRDDFWNLLQVTRSVSLGPGSCRTLSLLFSKAGTLSAAPHPFTSWHSPSHSSPCGPRMQWSPLFWLQSPLWPWVPISHILGTYNTLRVLNII